MGKLADLAKSAMDLKKLGGLQGELQKEFDKLEAEGKMPAELKTAVENLKNSGGLKKDNIGKLESFAEVLEKYESLLPDEAKKLVEKFESISSDLEKKVADHIKK